MKSLVLAAVALGLTACASDPASQSLVGRNLAPGEQMAQSSDRRVSNAEKVRQMQTDLQSTNERLARQTEAERQILRGLPPGTPVDQQLRQNGCFTNGRYVPCAATEPQSKTDVQLDPVQPGRRMIVSRSTLIARPSAPSVDA